MRFRSLDIWNQALSFHATNWKIPLKSYGGKVGEVRYISALGDCIMSCYNKKEALMLKWILFLLLFLTQPFASQSLGQELTYDQVQIFTNNCLKVIQSGNFDDEAELFHYPPYYSPKELDEDKKEVQLWLMELSKLFGAFDKSEIVQRPVSLYKIEIGGGDIPYWTKYPQFIEVK